MPLAYLPPMNKRLPDRTLKEFRGVNKADPFTLDPRFSPAATNMTSSKAPALNVKPGFSLLGTAIGSRVIGLAAWKNTEQHAIFSDGTWRKWNGSAWVTLTSGLDTSADWAFCNFKANLGGVNLIATNGVSPVMRYDGTTVQALTNAPSGLKYIDQHDNRLYGAKGNMVLYSGLSLADEWTLVGTPNDSSPGGITRETNDGEDIVALLSGAGHVTVFFPNSSHELYGTSPSDFSFQYVAEDFGAINDQSITLLGGLMYFLDETGIYTYSGGTRPSKAFSRDVQWYIENMNKSAKQYCCMGQDGRYMYVGIPMTSNTVADTLLVYDTQEQVWNVWNDLQPTHMIRSGDALVLADTQGRIMQIGGTTNGGVAINWEWQSKPFSGSSAAQPIRWTRAWITLDKPSGTTVDVYITKEPEGDGGWVKVGTLTAVTSIQSKPIYINPGAVGVAHWLRLKIVGSGPATIREISWSEIQGSAV